MNIIVCKKHIGTSYHIVRMSELAERPNTIGIHVERENGLSEMSGEHHRVSKTLVSEHSGGGNFQGVGVLACSCACPCPCNCVCVCVPSCVPQILPSGSSVSLIFFQDP